MWRNTEDAQTLRLRLRMRYRWSVSMPCNQGDAGKPVFQRRDWPGLRSLTSQEIAGCTDTDGDVRQKKNDVLFRS